MRAIERSCSSREVTRREVELPGRVIAESTPLGMPVVDARVGARQSQAESDRRYDSQPPHLQLHEENPPCGPQEDA